MACPSPDYQPRNLIVCFDGTGNSFDDENTNVVRIFSALEKQRTDKQLCYYQPGIGTYNPPNSMWSPLTQKITKLLDEGFAWYLDGHIMGGYRFLMENYTKGDKIYLFGFSRGAYTARCLAGMLHKVGLLPKSNEEQVSFAYEKYKDTSEKGRKRAEGFKAAFSTDVDIEFVGVWDTVASVGFFGRHLPFTSSNTIIRTFRHALALDEHRAKFKPNPWHRPAPNKKAAAKDPDCGTAICAPPPEQENVVEATLERLHLRKPKREKTTDTDGDEEEDDHYHTGKDTDVKEVWFAGCHADVGGGSVDNNVDHTLANPSLMWLVNELIKASPGIIWRDHAFSDIKAFETITSTLADPTPRHRPQIPSAFMNSRRGRDQSASEATAVDGEVPPTPSTSTTKKGAAEAPKGVQTIPENGTGEILLNVFEDDPSLDANAPMYDQLKRKPIWWILELLPLWQYYQDPSGHWHEGLYWNLGRPRNIEDERPFFHSSVKLRENYKPRAKLPRGGEPVYTD
ncbi:hypothetical protein FRB99_006190 [Tulasnella sp. 403]|nr:hypothetical protein FRB99_006190 [Tulasnella sp. 403]